MTYKLYSIIFCTALATVGIANLSGGDALAKGEDGDLVGRIEKTLPPGWSVDISTFEGKCYVDITTDRLETQGSVYGQSFPGKRRMQLSISIIILPRYTPEMMARIKKYNAPLRKKLKALNYYSNRHRELSAKLIDEPMFYDENYGFEIRYPSRVPSKAEDTQKLMKVLETISSNWKSYDKNKLDVTAELRRILTR